MHPARDLKDIKKRLAEMIGPSDVSVSVFEYAEYEQQKKKILRDHYHYRFAPGLDWLYDPDSSRDNVFTRAQWGEEYQFVVVLEGDNEEGMYDLSGRILEAERQVGIVYLNRFG